MPYIICPALSTPDFFWYYLVHFSTREVSLVVHCTNCTQSLNLTDDRNHPGFSPRHPSLVTYVLPPLDLSIPNLIWHYLPYLSIGQVFPCSPLYLLHSVFGSNQWWRSSLLLSFSPTPPSWLFMSPLPWTFLLLISFDVIAGISHDRGGHFVPFSGIFAQKWRFEE